MIQVDHSEFMKQVIHECSLTDDQAKAILELSMKQVCFYHEYVPKTSAGMDFEKWKLKTNPKAKFDWELKVLYGMYRYNIDKIHKAV